MRASLFCLLVAMIGLSIGCKDEKYLKEKEEMRQQTLKGLRLGAIMGVVQKNYEEAKGKLKKLEEMEKFNADDYSLRGEVNEGLGQNSSALEDYNKSIEMDPKKYKVLERRGKLLVKMGQAKEGKADLDKAKQMSGQK